MKTTLTLASLATNIGKTEEVIPLPNGSSRTGLNWKGEDLLVLDAHLRTHGFGRDSHVVFDGAMPAFIGLALVHGVHPGFSSLNDPRLGEVAIPQLTPAGKGSGLNSWKVTDNGDHFLVEFDCGATFDVASLAGVVPPDLSGKGIVLSGRGPNWLTVAIAMSYHAKAPWVACFQPGIGATVAMTHVPEMPLGTLIGAPVPA